MRKRPIFQKEINNGEIDCISIINPRVYIHECKIQIDGITKYLEDHEFYFDGTFGEKDNTIDLYKTTLSPMINLILNEGIVTCFAYGQTGSGKTYTMKGLEKEAIDDLYRESKKMGGIFDFYVSFFEIYRGNLYDLLNNKNKVEILDDKNGKVHIYGLYNQIAESPEIMHHIIDSANAIRTTHNTVTNETSSRSHAICNIVVKLKGSEEEYGKLSLVDLAGSERAQETKCNDKERRAEGAEINKSLLALKECIRALDEKKTNPDQHVPFRASKLTHVLRDSFVSKSDKSRIIMISCVTPSYTCCNHSLNTLRYSDRLKEKTKQHFGGNYNNINIKARSVNSNQVGNNNNIKSSYNINAKNNSNNENSGTNYIKKSFNQNLNSGGKSHKHQKSYTKENINQIKKTNNSNKSNNKNISKSKNKKINKNNDKKSDIASQKLMKEIKKSHKSNYKKKNILKTKNTFKYEDKFCMMNEDDIDLQKRKKYNYDKRNDDYNNNTYNFNNNIYNKISQEELMNKNYKNESDGERDWSHISKKKEKEKENISHKDDDEDEENYYNDDEENENSEGDNSNYEDEENSEQNEEEENDDNNNESGSDNDDNYDEHDHDDDDNENDYDNNNDDGNDNQIEDDDNIDEELGIIGEDIINTHMVYLREAANILSEEGDLVTNIKGVGKKNNITLDEYISNLEKIVDKKLDMYGDIKGKIRKYKKFVKNKKGKNY